MAAIPASRRDGLPDLAALRKRAKRLLRALKANEADEGLSLTQRLALRILADHGELPAGNVFGHLMMSYEPLPYLGDLMFYALLRSLIDAPHPLIHEVPGEDWRQRTLGLTTLGEQTLLGRANWLDQHPAERWVGGVRIVADQSPWVVDVDGRVSRR
ncbi:MULTISPECIES: hypothetical protein [Pseudomonas]|uniref:hypothetical protein n=1 Tax=Pseudomonas TaxID=286 RepID=UPI001BEBB949|nr:MULTISPECIES: hypothetical protein [Pseudomonas]MBT2338476.1 hypothetical protein [Pseudomonas fluorescens]MCD4531179.1 hypothetical protein [Pseudomonas sp. C3-2018]